MISVGTKIIHLNLLDIWSKLCGYPMRLMVANGKVVCQYIILFGFEDISSSCKWTPNTDNKSRSKLKLIAYFVLFGGTVVGLL